MKRIAVVLFNLGGPNQEEAVQPFLYNLFMDEDIIKIPLRGRVKRGLIRWITHRRAKVVKAKYAQINACPQQCLGPESCSVRQLDQPSTCCSATNPLTEAQRLALEQALNQSQSGHQYTVITAMRYWHPSTEDALDQLEKGAFDEWVLLPLYPQFSFSTTASSLNEWHRRLLARTHFEAPRTHIIKDYPTHPDYIAALNARIDEALALVDPKVLPQVHLLFSAHGTPVSFRERGDPYSFQIKASMEQVMAARGNDYPYWLSYQSRVGPVKWLQPNTEAFLKVLHGYGIRHLVVIPIAFVSDHIETQMEIEIEFKEVADELGYETFRCTQGLNTHPRFIAALADLVRERISRAAETSVS